MKLIAAVIAVTIAAAVIVSPGQSIQSAINAAAAGDVVHVSPGSYNERLNVNKAVTVICDVPQTCIILGAVLSGNAVLDGFYSLNSNTNDGALVANGSGNIIRHNKVENSCMVGIKLNGSGNRAEDNEILKSRQCTGSSGPDADGIRYFGSGQVMRGNYIHDILYNATNTTAHIDCFQTFGGASGAIIENNICDNSTRTSTLAGSGANLENDAGAIFRNNYFHTYGKKIMIETSSSGTIIEDNIFIGDTETVIFPSQYGLFGSGTGEVARNNVFYNIRILNGTSVLYGVSNGGGNLLNTDPKMDGYCSAAYPDRGVPCGVLPTGSPTPTGTAIITSVTNTPSPAPPAATGTPSKTPTPTLTAVCVPALDIFVCDRDPR
jgi:hypothetical protein